MWAWALASTHVANVYPWTMLKFSWTFKEIERMEWIYKGNKWMLYLFSSVAYSSLAYGNPWRVISENCTVESLVLAQEEDQWTCSLSLLCMWSNVEIHFYEGFHHIFISKILEWMTNIVWFLFKEGKSIEIEAYIMMLCIKGFYNLMMYWGLQLSLLLVEDNDTGIWSSDFKNLLLI